MSRYDGSAFGLSLDLASFLFCGSLDLSCPSDILKMHLVYGSSLSIRQVHDVRTYSQATDAHATSGCRLWCRNCCHASPPCGCAGASPDDLELFKKMSDCNYTTKIPCSRVFHITGPQKRRSLATRIDRPSHHYYRDIFWASTGSSESAARVLRPMPDIITALKILPTPLRGLEPQ
jgi:hypothetical protein